jgi:hypothetical protein
MNGVMPTARGNLWSQARVTMYNPEILRPRFLSVTTNLTLRMEHFIGLPVVRYNASFFGNPLSLPLLGTVHFGATIWVFKS